MAALVFALGALALTIPQAQAWWQPPVDTTWQILLSQPLKNFTENVQAFDFDLFDNPTSTVKAVHDNNRKAICYFSAGSWENWRPDAKDFKSSDLGRPLAHWKGERWLNTNSPNVRHIMSQRMDLAVSKGCDAIDPDNVDCYDNGGGGFGLTEADAISYVTFLASEGHKRGLAVGLKNAGAIIPKVLSEVDFAVNEQCLQYDECDTTRPFVDNEKPVFHIEYVKGTPSASYIKKTCSNPTSRNFSTLIKHLSLGYFTVACPAPSSKANQLQHTPSTKSSPASKTSSPHAAKPNNAGLKMLSGSFLQLSGISFALIWQLLESI